MSDQFIGQTLAEKYRIDSILRDGNFGKTYRATHVSMDKPVMVKILAPALAVDDQIIKQFSAEARAVSHISHPNILNVTDFGAEKNGAVYIVSDGADGATLKETIKSEGKFALERALKIAGEISAALAAAHNYNIKHGNLNAENILLVKSPNNEETAKVLDFGATVNDEITQENLSYRAPEQNASIAEIDERADVYALGTIVYEMLAGEVPFTAETPTDLLTKQAENPPAPLSTFRSDLLAEVEPVILKALARNPEMRYQTAREFTDDLNRAAAVHGRVAVPQAVEISDAAKNNLWKTAFVVLAGISLLAVGLIYMTQSKQTNPTTQLQPDANGQPVQPLNPATGMNEFGASNMMVMSPQMMANSNMMLVAPPPGSGASPTSDGYGDGYNPWAKGVPPPGAPPMQQGGQYIDPNNPNSIFMQDGTVLVPVPVNANVAPANAKPATTPKPTPAPANANVAPPSAPANTNPQTAPAKTPAPTAPKATPKLSPPTPAKTPAAATEKQGGKPQDSQ